LIAYIRLLKDNPVVADELDVLLVDPVGVCVRECKFQLLGKKRTITRVFRVYMGCPETIDLNSQAELKDTVTIWALHEKQQGDLRNISWKQFKTVTPIELDQRHIIKFLHVKGLDLQEIATESIFPITFSVIHIIQSPSLKV
jgi:hypothetical protein